MIKVDVNRQATITADAGVPVDVPSLAAPKGGLGSVATPTGPGVRLVTPESEAWTTVGLVFSGDPCGVTTGIPVGCGTTYVPPEGAGLYETVQASIVGVPQTVDCGTFAVRDIGEFETVAAARVDATLWGTVGAELWGGAVQATLPPGQQGKWLTNGDAVPVATGALPFDQALYALEEYAAKCSTGGERLFHVPVSVLDRYAAYGLAVPGEAPGRWRTPAGSLIIADPGYPAPVNGATELYVTGQIYGAVSPAVFNSVQYPGTNRTVVTATKAVAFGWFCCHGVVQVEGC
jgi:hypothetical protein